MASSERIVVLAPNWLGDAVMALPAIADIRRHFGTARLTVAARHSIAALFSLVSDVDEVVTLPGHGGVAALTHWKADSAALSAGHFDTAVLLPNSFAAAWSASRARIAERWGFSADWRSRLLTRSVPRASKALNQAGYYQALMAGLGMKTGPQFARVQADRAQSGPSPLESARQLLRQHAIDPSAPMVVLAPGAAYGKAKQWLPERFAELAALIARERRWPVVLVGTRADAPTCDAVIRDAVAAGADRASLINLAGLTDLRTLTGVLASARAVISNDSGVMHLAGAVGVKVVAIFGATNEHRTAPLVSGPDAPLPAIVTHQVFCRPCMLRECPIDHRCMRGVAASRVHELLPS